MAQDELINRMIATYRDLNILIRPVPETELSQQTGGQPSVRDVMQQLRDAELRFTQSTKELLTGQIIPDDFDEETPTLGMEHEGDPTRVLLSQFGTARESLLAMLREMTDEQWMASGPSGRTMVDRIEQLLENDQTALERVQSGVGSRATSAPV